jgi:hypothetical protein
MENYERIEKLEEAKGLLEEVVNLVDEALRGTRHQSHARAYILGHLEGWVDSPNRYNMGIEQYIEALREEEGYDEEEDEDY